MNLLFALLLLQGAPSDDASKLAAMFKARFALKSGDLVLAEQFVDGALAKGQVDPELAYLKVEVMLAIAAQNPLAGNILEITQTLKDFIALFPEDFRFPKALGLHLARESEATASLPSPAEMYLKKALTLLKDGPASEQGDTNYFLGLVLFRGQDFLGASDCFREVVRLDPQAEFAHYYAARALEQSHQLRSALAFYESYAKLSDVGLDEVPIPFSIKLLRLLIDPSKTNEKELTQWLMSKENSRAFYIDAISQLLDVSRFEPALAVLLSVPATFRDPNYYRLLAHARMSLHQYDTLFQEVETALASSPERVRLYLVDFAMESALASSRFADVLRLRQAYQVTPDMDLKLDLYAAFAEVLHNGGSSLWEHCLKKYPNSTLVLGLSRQVTSTSLKMVALRNLAQVYMEWGDWENALTQTLAAQHEFPNEPQINEDLAIAYYQMGYYDECFGLYERLLRVQPNREDLLNNYGFFLAESGRDLKRAKMMVEKALVQDPENGAYLDSLGWIYYYQKDYPLAESMIQRALATNADDPEKLEHLGDVYMKMGRLNEARKSWADAMEQRNDRYLLILDKLDPAHD